MEEVAPLEVTSCYNGDDGIAQFADRPGLVEPYLLPCIRQVADSLAESDLATTHIVLGATSGSYTAGRQMYTVRSHPNYYFNLPDF